MPARESSQGDLRTVPSNAPVANEDSAIVVGVQKTESKNSTGSDGYKTQFVKVYQDAGVIGASMLTLLVLCFLLGMFSLRLLKMYVALTQSRDKLDEARATFLERITERLLTLESRVSGVQTELRSDHTAQSIKLDLLVDGQGRFESRMDRMQDRESSRDRQTVRNDRDARNARHNEAEEA